jgi:predicted GNAT superfamily acetyltransferase
MRDGAGSDVRSLIPTPDDIITLRRTDPSAVAAWRASSRKALTTALNSGHHVVGFTRNGEYVIGP